MSLTLEQNQETPTLPPRHSPFPPCHLLTTSFLTFPNLPCHCPPISPTLPPYYPPTFPTFPAHYPLTLSTFPAHFSPTFPTFSARYSPTFLSSVPSQQLKDHSKVTFFHYVDRANMLSWLVRCPPRTPIFSQSNQHQ